MDKDVEIYVARILYPVKVLGPGKRIGIWLAGCEHHCDGCSNPELWEKKQKYKTNLESVMLMIKSLVKGRHIDGFTITGGDPFFQVDALYELLDEIEHINDDILVYTGYSYEDIKHTHSVLLDKIAVLIDGKYEREKNDGSFLRGSSNQRIIILKEKYKKLYSEYIESGVNEIQNFAASDGIVSVGIHRSEYQAELNTIIQKKGLKANE